MKQSEEFEWYEFNNLADSYIGEKNEAKQRTGVSRYYYGTFCTTRDFLKDNGIYLNQKSKEIMNSKKAEVHGETAKIFRKHNKFKKNHIGTTISKELNKLRIMRNKSDYDKHTRNSLEKMMIKSKMKSERILELLEEIN